MRRTYEPRRLQCDVTTHMPAFEETSSKRTQVEFKFDLEKAAFDIASRSSEQQNSRRESQILRAKNVEIIGEKHSNFIPVKTDQFPHFGRPPLTTPVVGIWLFYQWGGVCGPTNQHEGSNCVLGKFVQNSSTYFASKAIR